MLDFLSYFKLITNCPRGAYLVKEAHAEDGKSCVNQVVQGDEPLVIHSLNKNNKDNIKHVNTVNTSLLKHLVKRFRKQSVFQLKF